MESKVVYDVFHLVYWDWRIAFDLFLGGLGVGAFLYAISMMFYKNDDRLLSVRIGSVLGPIAMTAGLLFMLSEMGQPLRIWKTWTRFNLTSTLSWGGILQEGFIFFSGLFAVLLFTQKRKSLRQNFAVFAGFFAFFVACYHGFLLSFVTARPLWNAGAISVASIILSVNTGIAAVLLLSSFSSRGRQEIKELGSKLKNMLLILLLAQVSTCFIWIVTLLTGKADFVNAFHVLNRNFGPLFWLGAVFVGLVLPFIILAVSSTGSRRNQALPVFLIASCILVGGFIFRYVLILAGQLS